MTNAEIKNALFNRRPVIADLGINGELTFARVYGIIYRAGKNGKVDVSVELMDKNENSLVITSPDKIRYAN